METRDIHQEAVRRHLSTVLTEKFEVPEAELRPEATLADLDLDSLARVELFLTLQEHWGVPLADEDSAAELTLRQLVGTVLALIPPEAWQEPE
ncbi:phosphopantetheine-binding protein [Kitasatospora sp. NPDC002227]|uniref:acyl carrier protein n=1 Tax=Kitasatospora sp. NPDC002227 TaxID=3154773 RepID=UPI0033323A42